MAIAAVRRRAACFHGRPVDHGYAEARESLRILVGAEVRMLSNYLYSVVNCEPVAGLGVRMRRRDKALEAREQLEGVGQPLDRYP